MLSGLIFYMTDMGQLVDHARQGDSRAQATLYRLCRTKAVKACHRIVGDLPLSEELADDAFIVAFGKLHQLEDSRRFEPWLCQIARRLALRHLSRSHELPTIPLYEVAEQAHEEQPPLSEEEILSAVESLPQGYREVFRMSVIDGMSHLEIADQLGIHPHSSSSQLSRAKRMLCSMLQYGWLLLLLPLGWLVFHRPEDPPPIVAQNKAAETPPAAEGPTTVLHPATTVSRRPSAVDSTPTHTTHTADSLPARTAHTVDSTPEPTPSHAVPLDQPRPAELHDDRLIAAVPTRWSFTLSCNMPHATADLFSQPYSLPMADGTTTDNWRDYLTATSSEYTAMDSLMANIAISNLDNNDGRILRAEHHQPPVVVSLAAAYRLSPRWNLATGLELMHLASTFTIGEGDNRIEQTQRLDYLGLPIGVHCRLLQHRGLSLYTSATAIVHLPVHCSTATDYYVDGHSNPTPATHTHQPPMLSFGIGVGVQWNITPTVSLFAEPSLRYHLVPDGAASTYLTQHPLAPTFPCGLRIVF